MRIIRRPWALALVLACSASAATVAAQVPPPPAPRAQPEVQAPPTPGAALPEDPDDAERRRYYFSRPIVRVAQDYTLHAGDTVREVRVFFGNVTIEGRVTSDVVVTMGSGRLGPSAVVEGTFAVVGGSATIDEGASVEDDLVVIGGTLNAPPTFSPGRDHVVVGSKWFGDALRDVAPWITRGLLWGRLIVPDLAWVWAVVGIFFLIYLALNVIFDRPVGACAAAIVERPLSMFMAGLLTLLLMVPVIALVAATVIGLALVPFILCAIIAAGLVGKAGVIRAIGQSVLRSESSDGRPRAAIAFAMGFALLTLAYMVPVLGFVTWALTTVLGFGGAAVTFRSMLRRERPVPPAVPAPVASAATMPIPASPVVQYQADAADIDAPPAAVAAPLSAPPPPAPRTAFSAGLAQYPRATFLDRVAAFALDLILVAIANAILDMNRYEGFFLLLLLAYHIAFWAWRGTTLGGIICSLRVIRTNGSELRFADSMVRGLSSIFSLAALGIGCLWMLQDPERQMWHDKIAGTLVVKVPRDLVLP